MTCGREGPFRSTATGTLLIHRPFDQHKTLPIKTPALEMITSNTYQHIPDLPQSAQDNSSSGSPVFLFSVTSPKQKSQ